jgi:hypothetical protein
MATLDKLDLQKMISENSGEDYTEQIREKQHSQFIKHDIKTMMELKKKYSRLAQSNPNQFDQMCVSKCNFLFNNYTDIYNRVKKDELDMNIMWKFLDTLKEVEDGLLSQHDASVKVGTLLKNLYVDSALRKSEKLDKRNKNKKKPNKEKNISWQEFKKMSIK